MSKSIRKITSKELIEMIREVADEVLIQKPNQDYFDEIIERIKSVIEDYDDYVSSRGDKLSKAFYDTIEEDFRNSLSHRLLLHS